MILREFDLDLPGYPKDDRDRFRNETRCVTALYELVFRKNTKQRIVVKL